jgi:hypothetical protein
MKILFNRRNMTRTKRNSAKNRAKIYGFSEFLDFPERVQRQFYTIYAA